LNSEFYRTNAGGLFQNSAFGIGTEFGQSWTEGPSIFPRTSAGLRLAVKPSDDLVLRAAVLDGVPVVRPDGSHGLFRSGDGWLMVAEAAWLSRANVERELKPRRDLVGRQSSRAPYVSKIAIGTWRYTTRLDDLSAVNPTGEPVRRRGSAGVYAVGETPLLADQASIRKLSAFGQLGFADPRTNCFNSYVGAGVVGSGWVPQRADDEVGVSFARSHNGSHYLTSTNSAGARGAETTFEATYLVRCPTTSPYSPICSTSFTRTPPRHFETPGSSSFDSKWRTEGRERRIGERLASACHPTDPVWLITGFSTRFSHERAKLMLESR